MSHLQLIPVVGTPVVADWRSAPPGSLLQVRELPDSGPLASPQIVFRLDDRKANGAANSVLVIEGASAGIIRSVTGNQFWPAIDVSGLVELCIRNAGPTRVAGTEPEIGQLVMLLDDQKSPRPACFMAAGYKSGRIGYVCLQSELAEYTPGSIQSRLDSSRLLRAGSAEIRELRRLSEPRGFNHRS